jgi:hypothetical protein
MQFSQNPGHLLCNAALAGQTRVGDDDGLEGPKILDDLRKSLGDRLSVDDDLPGGGLKTSG